VKENKARHHRIIHHSNVDRARTPDKNEEEGRKDEECMEEEEVRPRSCRIRRYYN
jgi:hypothetical protein